MKSIVVYSSQTGNTQKLAEAVFSTLEGEKMICNIDEAPEPAEYDFVSIGFWVMAGKPDPKTQAYLKKIQNQKLFLFATHGAAATSQHAQNAMATAKNMAPDAEILGSFSCPGEVNPKVLEKVKSKPEPPVWLDDAPNAVGHPNKEDLAGLTKQVNESL